VRRIRLVLLTTVLSLVAVLAGAFPATAATRDIHGSVTGGLFSCAFNAVTQSYLVGQCTVTDTASDGRAVYVQHKYISDHAPDSAWMRLTGNAGGYNHSTTYDINLQPLYNPTRPFWGNVDHWAFRVCTTSHTDKPWLPYDDDRCGYQHVLDSQ
jgi:hypothetical protein